MEGLSRSALSVLAWMGLNGSALSVLAWRGLMAVLYLFLQDSCDETSAAKASYFESDCMERVCQTLLNGDVRASLQSNLKVFITGTSTVFFREPTRESTEQHVSFCVCVNVVVRMSRITLNLLLNGLLNSMQAGPRGGRVKVPQRLKRICITVSVRQSSDVVQRLLFVEEERSYLTNVCWWAVVVWVLCYACGALNLGIHFTQRVKGSLCLFTLLR